MSQQLVTRKAGEIMVPLKNYPTITHDITLAEAVDVMIKSFIDFGDHKAIPRALLVEDKRKQIIGIVRRRDILSGLEPKYLKTLPMHHRGQLFNLQTDPNLLDLSTGKIARAIREQSNHPVSEVMKPIIETVDFDDHLAKIIYLMVHKNRALIPVLKKRRVVGIIRTVDIINEIVHLFHDES